MKNLAWKLIKYNMWRNCDEIEANENFGSDFTKLQMYRPDEAHKLLGVLTDPAGTGRDQVEYMSNQAREWNTRDERPDIIPAETDFVYNGTDPADVAAEEDFAFKDERDEADEFVWKNYEEHSMKCWLMYKG